MTKCFLVQTASGAIVDSTGNVLEACASAQGIAKRMRVRCDVVNVATLAIVASYGAALAALVQS